ncbi:hypothetical protein P7K49_008587 [Saguinus oedipus]|uniref:Uncharacterized protein n=1 Tax=Saguinus oedipus TaxID=9490 RepID=A0ABQ9VYX0_SAGOE|nr:hypothetical protein P7K49_008587 [Saguinus oedipus]
MEVRSLGPGKGCNPSPCLDCTSLLMCLWLPRLLRPLRLAAPEEQQEEEDPGGSRHHSGTDRLHFSGARGVAAARSPGPGL